MIVKHRYTRRREAVWDALGYFGRRAQDGGEGRRGLFTAEGSITRYGALLYLDRAGTDHLGRYLTHTLIISPSSQQCPESLSELTRYSLRELEKDKTIPLRWVAAIHRNTDHPHVHIAVRGSRLRLECEDHRRLVEYATRYCALEERLRAG